MHELDVNVPLLDTVATRQKSLATAALDLLDVKDRPVFAGCYAHHLTYALALHLVEGTLSAAKHTDVTTIDAYANDVSLLVSRFSIDTPIGERLVMQPDFGIHDRYLEVDTSKMKHLLHQPPCPIIWKETGAVHTDQLEVLRAAIQSACSAGFADLIGGHAPIICLCPVGASGDDPLQNWTVTLLSGTVYLTVDANPFLMARELVHEAGHNWLGSAFAGMDHLPDDDVLFFSPWKNRDRPAPAFLHTCWSFSLTVLYSQSILEHCDSATSNLLMQYTAVQRRVLYSVRDDFDRALQLLDHRQVHDVMESVFATAVDI